MRIAELHVRFYKAFNFDYMRKYDRDADRRPWETMEDGSWYPFVNVPIERGITTVVGANESGKSQVLDAIEIALTGSGLQRTDFCRYSKFFLVDKVIRLPDLGLTFQGLTTDEATQVADACGRGDESVAIDEFTLIRSGAGATTVFVREGSNWHEYRLNAKATKQVDASLPVPLRLHPDIPLPDAVPLSVLAGAEASNVSAVGSRKQRLGLIERLLNLSPSMVESSEAVTKHAAKVAEALVPRAEADDVHAAEKYALARDLLVEITGINAEHFADLVTTIGDGRDGYVDGVEELINRALASRLNFRRWWTQDRRFQLQVTVRESDIAFVIRDRTGTAYSFSERSSGLSYFLSYFVQYLRHRPHDGRDEVLLMDEPDTYLSSQGQKDLLRIFDAFAHPDDGTRGCQVVYVTHSPFLIDRNHADRIRVIEKGEEAEGTRVVRDVSRNHYEPLRSAFGAFVAETTFMGNCNLMVEGVSDQVLLAGMSRRLRRSQAPRNDYLDLNDMTLVPAGGAPHIPYLTYLARGRDVEKPAVIVLLDGDGAGDDARKAIRKGGAYRKPLVSDDLVLQLNDTSRLGISSDRSDGPIDVEDLIPAEIALLALQRYATQFAGLEPAETQPDPAHAQFSEGVLKGTIDLVNAGRTEVLSTDKLGFARSVLDVLDDAAAYEAISPDALARMDDNFRSLFQCLNAMRRTAVRARDEVRLEQRIARVRDGFLADHPVTITKIDVQDLIEELEHVLDDTPEGEATQADLRRLRSDHNLDVDPNASVEDVESLREDLIALQYGGRRRSQESPAGSGTGSNEIGG